MNWLSSSKWQWRGGTGLGLALAAVYALSIGLVTGADPKPEKAQKPEKKTEKKTEKKKLSGSELYSIHCGRCHAERYPTEFTASQWQTVVMEMRVRANLPAVQAKAILKYLQEDSGTP
jgi:mono/diheme cytochrome c family protein